MNERIEELKAEIERLEAIDNLGSEEFAQLKTFKEELKKLETAEEAEAAKKSLSVRALQRRDLQVLQTLVKDYPGFKELPPGDQLDRMVLVLTNVCGFGGVLVSTMESVQEQISYKVPIDVLDHFQNSTWVNREGVSRKRYVNNFADAYKLDPGLSLKLTSERQGRSDEEPIRKVVPGRKIEVAPAPVVRAPQPSPSAPTPSPETGALIREPSASNPRSASILKPEVHTKKTDKPPVRSEKKSALILGGIGAGVLFLALVLWAIFG